MVSAQTTPILKSHELSQSPMQQSAASALATLLQRGNLLAELEKEVFAVCHGVRCVSLACIAPKRLTDQHTP